jgi:hypothetical protein
MLVTARKPSSDPIQEKLRQDKANWNKKTSLFITRVLHFKKLMNGAPNLFYKQKSKITQPIPADPTALLGSLVHEFQEITQQGSSLVEEQLAYSKNHRPKQPASLPQSPATSTPTASPGAPAPDLAKQLAAWEQKYDLVAEGSNPLSRFLTRRITRTRGTSERFRINRMRLDMLESCTKARKALSKLQIQIVKGNKESIAESQKIMQHVWNEWAVVARTFNNYKNKSAIQLQDKEIELPTDEAMDPNKETLIDAPLPVAAPPVAPMPTAKLIQPKPIVNKVPPPVELPEEITDKTINKPLEVVAQAFVKKWLGKKRHQFFSQNTSSYRLEIFEMAKAIRVDLNNIMNLLEKGLNVEQLQPLISQVNRQMTNIRMMMRSLNLSEKPGVTDNQIF